MQQNESLLNEYRKHCKERLENLVLEFTFESTERRIEILDQLGLEHEINLDEDENDGELIFFNNRTIDTLGFARKGAVRLNTRDLSDWAVLINVLNPLLFFAFKDFKKSFPSFKKKLL